MNRSVSYVHRMRLLRPIYSVFITTLTVLFLAGRPDVITAQQGPGGPGAAFFSYSCGSSSISFSLHGAPVFEVMFSEIIYPLAQALSTQQNQFIKSTSEVSLWALKSDELQIHQNKDPDLTKLILSSTICGPLYAAPASTAGSNSAQALALVQVNGPGQGVAFAQVTSDGQVMAFAAVSGNGTALAGAQFSSMTGLTYPEPLSGRYHIVQRGENLFRIALRYSTSVAILAQINNITDPARISIGQKIYLP